MISQLFFSLATAGFAAGLPNHNGTAAPVHNSTNPVPRYNGTTAIPHSNSTSGLVHVNSTMTRGCSLPWFNSTTYECFPGGKLCPKYNGSPLLPCGDACYYPRRYGCHDAKLVERESMREPFQIFASNPDLLKLPEEKLVIQACHNAFFLQDGPACTYCPPLFKEQYGRCLGDKDTVLRHPHSMEAQVAGGQQWYIAPSGAMGYTNPHSTQSPKGSIFDGVDVYEDGAFMFRDGNGWVACPPEVNPAMKDYPTTFPDKHYQIYAVLPGRDHDKSCIPINIIAKPFLGEIPATWNYT